MARSPITWLVLARDVPPTVRVQGMDDLDAALVLDVDTGLVLGVAIETGLDRVLERAFAHALTTPVGDPPPGPPARVLCAIGLADPAVSALSAMALDTLPPIIEVAPGPEAEDIFDSFLGHMAGRKQPEETPTPADWLLLIEHALAFRRGEPWVRWSDEQELAVVLQNPDGAENSFTAVIMGQAGVQRGLALYPGDELPPGLRDRRPPEHPPAEVLLLLLDPVDELPTDLAAKAVRYGWPADDELMPVFMTTTSAGAEEVSRSASEQLAAGLAAVVALDRRGPALVTTAPPTVSGSVTVASGTPIGFRALLRPAAPEREEPELRVHVAGHDLLTQNATVTLGSCSWQALSELRGAARMYRPAPADVPEQAGRDVPLVVISTEPKHASELAARIADLDPYTVATVETDDAPSLVVLAGGKGSEILMHLPAAHSALGAFRRRLSQARGRHAVIVADPAAASGDGIVYAVFECHQPPPPPRPRSAAPMQKR
jgi:hypothetical protein